MAVTQRITGTLKGKLSAEQCESIARVIDDGLGNRFTVQCILGSHGCHIQIQKNGMVAADYWPNTMRLRMFTKPAIDNVKPECVAMFISGARS